MTGVFVAGVCDPGSPSQHKTGLTEASDKQIPRSLLHFEFLPQIDQSREAIRVGVRIVERQRFAAVGRSQRVEVRLPSQLRRFVGRDRHFQPFIGANPPVVGRLAVGFPLPILAIGTERRARRDAELKASEAQGGLRVMKSACDCI